jgi:hypothetical protein
MRAAAWITERREREVKGVRVTASMPFAEESLARRSEGRGEVVKEGSD